MPLEDICIPEAVISPSEKEQAFIQESERRIDAYFNHFSDNPVSIFLPSSFGLVLQVLKYIQQEKLALGQRFLEWGSGHGTITGLAAMLGFEACGIEFEEGLVSEARKLCHDFDISAEFFCTSYVPKGCDYFTDPIGGGVQFIKASCESNEEGWYEEAQFHLEDMDVVFVYPWPHDEEFFERVFEAFTTEGALLITYHGEHDIRLRQKVA